MADSTAKDPNPIATVVVKRSDGISTDVLAKTPVGQPNVAIAALHPLLVIAVRGARVYMQTFLGIATALQTGFAHKVGIDFGVSDLGSIIAKSAALALAPVFFTVLQNALEVLTKLDETMPQLRG